jgi:acetyl esterase
MDMLTITKRAALIILVLFILFVIYVIFTVHQWSTREQGYLPPKTAVILHAINHNLVTLDMDPPEIFKKRGVPKLIKENTLISVSDGTRIPVRIYTPLGNGPYPIIMYYHGGAFLEGFGGIETHDNVAQSLSVQTGSIVISVGYRLAPTHIFPTATEDSYEALKWAADHATDFNGDKTRIAVVGDSAGGNIATVVAAMARDRNGPELKAQVLYYPVTTFLEDDLLPSRSYYDSGYYLLSRHIMHLARERYTPEESMWSSPYTSPLYAEDLTNLPPTLIITSEFDPVRDEGEAYAQRLYESGVPVIGVRYKGVMHGFISFHDVMYSGRLALQESTLFLKGVFYDTNEIEIEPYKLVIRDTQKGLGKIRDHLEAYVFAAYLLGKKGLPL